MNWKEIHRQLVIQRIAAWRSCHLPLMRGYYRNEVRRAIRWYRGAWA